MEITSLTDVPLYLQVAGFTQALKMAGLEGKYAPLIACAWGVVLNLVESGFTLQNAILGGLTGLITTGCINLIDKRIEKLN
jgi:hypothetical protein